MSETNGPLPTCPINDIIPVEILGSIFEEHAKLEWGAPAIDGRVCRLWRQVVLNTPRAWAYLEVYGHNRPSISELRLWLHRSGAAPLHIRVDYDIPPHGGSNTYSLYDLLSDYHTRIASLQMVKAELSFFERKDFPCMRLLDVHRWPLVHSPLPSDWWGSMPQLQSLRLGLTDFSVAPLDGVAPLRMLSLHSVNCTSLPRHSPSLTRLMLEDVSLDGIISGPLALPSLTFLSLFNVTGLKPHIDAPYLSTYHDGGKSISESFSAPLRSLVEYGIYHRQPDGLTLQVLREYGIPYQDPYGLDPTVWNHYFPNVSRLSVRAPLHILIFVFDSLFGHTHLLPALQMISMEVLSGTLMEEEWRSIESQRRRRNEANHTDVVLHIEDLPPYHIPLFFAGVSRTLLEDL